jgi:hypothetical protein
VIAVESAIILSSCLALLLGMLELSVVLVRNTVAADVSRRVARAAIVHGESANATLGSWGPASMELTADSGHPVALAARPALMVLNPSDVHISVVWPDGGNLVGQRVLVTVSILHHPIVSALGYGSFTLQGMSIMRIAH